jgi:ethanolamine utilization protein EutN
VIIGKVVGTVVTTVGVEQYKSRRLLVVQPLSFDDQKPDDDFIALDNTHAGVGDTVLVMREGRGAREIMNDPNAPVISLIVGIVDSLYLDKN